MDDVLTEETEARNLTSHGYHATTTTDEAKKRGLYRIIGPVFVAGIIMWVMLINFLI